MKTIVFLALLVVCFAAPGKWQALPGGDHLGSVIMGIAAATDEKVYVAGGDNGVGAAVFCSKNGGESFTSLPIDRAMMLMDVAFADENNGATAGLGVFGIFSGSHYTLDGETFNASLASAFMMTTQCVKSIDKGIFGWVGTMDSTNGVALSVDGGITLQSFDWNGNTIARYGAFPTKNVWYVAGGTWPNSETNDEAQHLTERIAIYMNRDKKSLHLEFKEPSQSTRSEEYIGKITKTTDGGKTWETLFEDNGRFYFNDIECTSEEHCCAAAEGTNSLESGARIFCTFDGGTTWEQTLFIQGGAASIMSVQFVNEKEGWAAGGILSSLNFEAHFHYTEDGGKTWETVQHKGIFAMNFHFLPSGKAFAAVILPDTYGSVWKFEPELEAKKA